MAFYFWPVAPQTREESQMWNTALLMLDEHIVTLLTIIHLEVGRDMLQIFLQPSIALKNKHRGRHVVALKLLFRGESAWYQSVGGRQRMRGVWSTQDKEDACRIAC